MQIMYLRGAKLKYTLGRNFQRRTNPRDNINIYWKNLPPHTKPFHFDPNEFCLHVQYNISCRRVQLALAIIWNSFV